MCYIVLLQAPQRIRYTHKLNGDASELWVPIRNVFNTYKMHKCSVPAEVIRRYQPFTRGDAFGHYWAQLEIVRFAFVDVDTKKRDNALDSHQNKLAP